MEWSEIVAGALGIYGAWAEWRARRSKKAAARLQSDLERIRAEAERLRRAQDLVEQARAARARIKAPP